MIFSVELREPHELILAAMLLTGASEVGSIQYVASLIRGTNWTYEPILNYCLNAYGNLDWLLIQRSMWAIGGLLGFKRRVQDRIDGSGLGKDKATSALAVLTELELVARIAKYKSDQSGKPTSEIVSYSYTLTDEGRVVAQKVVDARNVLLRPPSARRTTVFVASAFGHTELDELYERELASACASVACTSVRVDMTEPAHTITAAIVNGIANARCVMADITHARQSVYFEVGLAHGLGVPVILTCRSDHYRGASDIERVHFDLEQYKISYWTRMDSGDFSWAKGMSPTQRIKVLLGGSTAT